MDDEGKKYNHDLLIHEEDRRWIRKKFPSVAWIAIDDTLREKFAGIGTTNAAPNHSGGYDGMANQAKTRSRQFGLGAVFLASIALLLAAAEPLLHAPQSTVEYGVEGQISLNWVGAIVAFLGLLGGVLGSLGVLRGKKKERWLKNRSLTERIRQQYFQFVIRRLSEIHAADTDDDKKTELKRERDILWMDFKREYEDADKDWIGTYIDDEDEIHAWIVKDSQDGLAKIPLDHPIFDFYETQRFNQQLGYAQHIRRLDSAMFSSAPLRQAQVLSSIGFLCVALLLLIHLVLGIVLALSDHPPSWEPVAHVAAIWLAIFALTAKTIEEGLRPDRELQRHRTYESRIRAYKKRYTNAKTVESKVRAMHEMEQLSYWEMREFLRNHEGARFSL